jgi:hypothetical protein
MTLMAEGERGVPKMRGVVMGAIKKEFKKGHKSEENGASNKTGPEKPV